MLRYCVLLLLLLALSLVSVRVEGSAPTLAFLGGRAALALNGLKR